MNGTSMAPMHLWIVGGLALLWNGFGCYDYFMTQSGDADYAAMFTEAQRVYFAGFPIWMDAAWAFGVWGGLAGSLLLLARSRHAVTAFIVSLAGLAVGSVYQFVLSSPPEMGGTMVAVTVTIWAMTILLLVYALAMRRRNVLR